jgi:hypothetical protein
VTTPAEQLEHLHRQVESELGKRIASGIPALRHQFGDEGACRLLFGPEWRPDEPAGDAE